MMQKILEGVCRPLKLRIEQILVAEPGPVILYKLSNLLQFYHQTIQQIVDSSLDSSKSDNLEKQNQSDLLETLQELEGLCKKMFFNSLTFMAQKFTSNVVAPPSDLSCNSTLSSALKLLREILSIQDGNVAPLEARQNDFQAVLSTVLGKKFELIWFFFRQFFNFTNRILRSIASKLSVVSFTFINGRYECLYDQFFTSYKQYAGFLRIRSRFSLGNDPR